MKFLVVLASVAVLMHGGSVWAEELGMGRGNPDHQPPDNSAPNDPKDETPKRPAPDNNRDRGKRHPGNPDDAPHGNPYTNPQGEPRTPER